MRTRSSFLAAAALAALMLMALAPASVTAAPPADWGWAAVRAPAKLGYAITGRDRGNSAGGVVEYERNGIGLSTVRFFGLTGDGGTIHVTPLTSKSDICSIDGWGGDADQVSVDVHCFDRFGIRKNVPYVVSYVRAYQLAGVFGYVWANQPGSDAYDPESLSSGNSTGGTNHAVRTGVGTYRIILPGLGRSGGNVQVSGYGDEHWPCRTNGWTKVGADESVGVVCRDETGTRVDSRFTMSFMKNEGLKADAGRSWAFVLANRPRKLSYTPGFALRQASPVGRPRITRLSRGVYSVRLPSMPLGGVAHVTPFGNNSPRCNVSSIRKFGKPQRIGVRCFNARGTARADAAFSLTFEK